MACLACPGCHSLLANRHPVSLICSKSFFCRNCSPDPLEVSPFRNRSPDPLERATGGQVERQARAGLRSPRCCSPTSQVSRNDILQPFRLSSKHLPQVLSLHGKLSILERNKTWRRWKEESTSLFYLFSRGQPWFVTCWSCLWHGPLKQW